MPGNGIARSFGNLVELFEELLLFFIITYIYNGGNNTSFKKLKVTYPQAGKIIRNNISQKDHNLETKYEGTLTFISFSFLKNTPH